MPPQDNSVNQPTQGYSGDISPKQAYDWWQAGEGVLIDVRSTAERTWVGQVPGALALPWCEWPGMQPNPQFAEDLQNLLEKEAVAAGQKLLFLCRSGVRSIAAARCATALGWPAYNVLEGFEGPPNAQGQRNQLQGWRVAGLPWQQG